ncbi:MAG: hypothetical protein E6G84_14350 [Alphaproteobacteria bacterium]|nr:MAG: hypothetical protein E6G84_14350 [Alphaproteobacteria bacterium]
MIQRSLRRLFLRPGFKGGEIGERRQVVAAARSHQLFDCRRLREMHQQALCRLLVLAERPDSPEIGDAGCKPALRARGHAVGPALFGDLRRITLGHRPGARRVHDQRAAAVPNLRIMEIDVDRLPWDHELFTQVPRIENGHLLVPDTPGWGTEPNEEGLRPERVEDRARSIHRIRRCAEPDAEREAGLLARLGRLEKRLERPVLGLRRRAGRIHGLHIDAGMLFHQVDARARPLDLAADRGRHRDPTALGLAEIFDRGIHGAILLDQRLHDVVDRFELVGMVRRQPSGKGEDVVAGLGLGFGGDRQQKLLSLGRNVVDQNLDLFLGRPLLDQRLRRVVGARHPMVPKADREPAGRMRAPDVRHCNQRRRGRRRREKTPSRELAAHVNSSQGEWRTQLLLSGRESSRGRSGQGRLAQA